MVDLAGWTRCEKTTAPLMNGGIRSGAQSVIQQTVTDNSSSSTNCQHNAKPDIASAVPLISVYRGPIANTTDKSDITWPELAEKILDEPEFLNTPSEKERGAYFIRGHCHGERNDNNLQSCCLVILDVDKPVDNLPMPTPEEIHQALPDVAHTTHNTATPGRCRIIFPVKPYDKTETKRVTRAAYQLCRERGLNFQLSGESNTKSQGFFLPQTIDVFAHQAFANIDAEFFDPDTIDQPPMVDGNQRNSAPVETPQNGGGQKHLANFIKELQSGTIHEAAKVYAGWLRRVTNLTIRQIFDDLTVLVDLHCADRDKVDRWHKKERESLEKWFSVNADFRYIDLNESDQNTEADQDLSVLEWPQLDDKALHGFAGRFVRFAVQNSEADPAAVLATFLVRFGVEVSQPTMWIGDSQHKALLAAVIVGASSKARKGTSYKPVKRLFAPSQSDPERGIADRAKTTPGPFSSGEGIIHAVRDAVDGIDKKTGEPIQVDPGVDDKRLFIGDEEFAGAMAQTKREGNTLSMIIRCAWDGNTLDPLTKTTKIRATNPHIGWVSHITLNELNTRLSETEMFNGYANRILWVCARRSKLIAWPEPMDGGTLAGFQYELSQILSHHQEPVTISPDRNVRQIWQEKYYRELTQDRPGMVGCVLNRAEAQALRLAMIYSLLDKSHTIRVEHLEAALAFWQYCEDSAKYIFHSRQHDTIAQKIVEALEDGPLTGTEIHRLFSSHVTKSRLESALSELTAADRIESSKKSTGGRPVISYFLKSPGVISVKSVKTDGPIQEEPLITLNTLNTPDTSKKYKVRI